MKKLFWKSLGNSSAEILTQDQKSLATYSWGNQRRHPFFHPLYSYGANQPLTAFAPWDHRWHKGLWWSWKMINGIVFWENATPNGENEGQSHVVDHCVRESKNGTIEIMQQLEMRVVASQQLVMIESRRLVARPAAPGFTDAWALDWDMTSTAIKSCELTVTPYPENEWGGYMGLNYRPNRCMGWGETLQNSNGKTGKTKVHGEAAKWAAYAGNLDGDEHDSAAMPAQGGLAILDHPSNPRHPTPFYAWSSGADNRGFGFLSASMLMHDKIVIKTKETLRLRYRVIPFDGAINSKSLNTAWRMWAMEK